MKKRKLIHKVVGRIAAKGTFNKMSDEKYIKLIYWARLAKHIDLKNPKTYNEKLQWLKLYDRNPLYTKMVDKYEAKNYVASIIGDEYVIPTYGVWERFEDIDFSSLPKQFVLKCTHDSGGLVICKDKSKIDLEKAKNKINKSLKTDYFLHGREWPYKDVPRKIIAEKYMSDNGDDIKDYKFYCFNGKVKLIGIYSDRNSKLPTKANYYNEKFERVYMTWGYEPIREDIKKPAHLNKMIEIAEKLSSNIPELRVDLYLCQNKIFFGELTFFDGGGLDMIEPQEWDYKMGEWIKLPIK